MTTSSYWISPPTEASHLATDVLIVGAGITGLSLAYWIKKYSPKLKVTIIDEGQLGRGATGRNAGFNTAGSSHYLAHLMKKHGESKASELWDFKQESLRLMRQEIFSRIECGFRQWGSFTLYRDKARFEEHLEVIKKLHRNPWKTSTPDELLSKGLSDFAGAIVFTEEACLNPKLFLGQMFKLLSDQGVEFLLNEKIIWSEERAERWMTSRREIKAQTSFLAINGYLSRFDKNLNWVSPKRAQMIALNFNNKSIEGNFYDPDHKVYFRQDPLAPAPTLLVGGMRLLEEASENDDEDKVTPVIQHALQNYAQELFKEKFEVRARWSGVMGFSDDELPFISPIADLNSCYFVGGYSGHGMGMAFGVAQVAVKKMLGIQTTEVHLLKGF